MRFNETPYIVSDEGEMRIDTELSEEKVDEEDHKFERKSIIN